MDVNPNGPMEMAAALAVSVAIQQAIEIVDAVVTATFNTDQNPAAAGRKKAVLKVISLCLGMLAATVGKVDVLWGFSALPPALHWLVTGIALAGGTEGVNSVIKYLGYAKENKKLQASAALDPNKKDAVRVIARR